MIKYFNFRYSLGDMIRADCMSPHSVPAANLTWYINSDTADINLITSDSIIVTEPEPESESEVRDTVFVASL